METIDTKIAAALIAAAASLIVSIVGAIWGRRNQQALETLKSELAEETAEKNARRDYKYDARKRLYEECEPLLFQANEATENTLHRIHSLARTSRAGNLGFGKESWLASPGYYATSTFYKLITPLVIFKLIQQRLTLVDLTVDPVVKARYDLLKWLYLSYTDDFEFARGEPKLIYDPYEKNWTLRKSKPQQHWRQGIPYGILDRAVESLIVKQGSEQPRYMSFGEFEKAYFTEGSETREAFEIVTEVFVGFHPRTRPILWRILIAQAHLCVAIIETGQMEIGSPIAEFHPLRLLNKDERNPFDWRKEGEAVSDDEVVQPFLVAQKYLEDHLPELLSRTESCETYGNGG